MFPELGLSAYTCDDLFHQQALIEAAEDALARLLEQTRNLPLAALVGLPVAVDGLLYNCAALVCQGRLRRRGAEDLPAELPRVLRGPPVHARRHRARRREIRLAGQRAPFGTDLLFRLAEQPKLVLHVEICEDLWVPAPPSSFAALAGATVIANLSASNVVVGKEGYRHQLVGNQSARCLAAYLYSAAGLGRIDHRPRLGRPRADLRERHAARRVAALRRRAAARARRRRPRPPARRPHAAEHLRRRGAPPRGPRRFRTVEFSLPLPRRTAAAGAQDRAASLRARATRARATRAARRSTASRCRAWRRACAPPARRSW